MKILNVLAAALALLPLVGCAAQTPAQSDYAPQESQRLTIYTSHKEEVYLPIIREFEERTGIWVDIVSGGTNEILDRIAAEQDDPVADVMFGGGVESLQYYQACFSPYVTSEADSIQDAFRAADDIWTPFSALPIVLIYNTKLVNPEQLQSWEDLNDPYFRGKIAFADPAISGSCYTALITRLLISSEDQETTMARLAQSLQFTQFDSSSAALAAVEDGSFLVGITLEETAMKHISSGADIAVVYPSDGTSCVPDGSALVKNAPHSENAKRFLDFTVSLDVQDLLAENFFRRTIRSDIPADDSLPPLSGLTLVDYDAEWASRNRNTILSNWAFFLKEAEQ